MASSTNGNAATPGADGSLAHYGVKLLLTNQFSAASKLYADKFNEDPKVALLHSFLSYGNAISSYSEADLKACVESCKRTEAIGEKLEKAGKKDEAKRIEGMLIQADCALLTACVNLVAEEYVKMMWNMRKSYNMYQDVQKLVDKYQGPAKAELAGWVKYGTGLFNILLSQLPPAVMSFAENIGYEGDRDKGLKLLSDCQQGPSFNAPFAALLLLVYYLTISPLTGDTIPGGMDHAKRLIDWGHVHYPNGAFFALMESRYYRSICDTRKAIDVAAQAEKTVAELPPDTTSESIRGLFNYQTAWCYFFCLDWQHSAEDFDRLLHSTLNGDYQPPGAPKPTTPATTKGQKEPTQASAQGCYAYQIGLCYAMLGDWHKAAWYMESVPVWLKKAGGIPKEIDKYAKRKAAEFLARRRRLKEDVLLDVMDLLHAWNGYGQMPKDALDTAQAQLRAAQDAVKEGKLQWDIEEVVRWELANAAILATKGDYKGAHGHLAPLIEKQKAFLKSDKAKKSGLRAFFYFELANATFHLGDVAQAKEWQKKSAKTEDYDLYRQLQVRLHTLKLKIKDAEKHGKGHK